MPHRLAFLKRLRASTWVLIVLGIAFLTGLPHYQTSLGGLVVVGVAAAITYTLRRAVDAIAAALLAIFVQYWLNTPR